MPAGVISKGIKSHHLSAVKPITCCGAVMEHSML
jgi:hypothetical protein